MKTDTSLERTPNPDPRDNVRGRKRELAVRLYYNDAFIAYITVEINTFTNVAKFKKIIVY